MNLKIYEITYGETILESGDAASRIVTYDTVFSNQGAEGPVGPPGPQGIQGLPGDFVVNFRVVSAAETLISKAKIAANTTSGALTLTLPVNPTNGDVIDFYDYAETFDTNNLTIARNGSRIEGLEENLICNVKGAYFSLVYSGSTRGWQVLPSFGTSGGGGETVLTTQGDTLYRGLGVNQRLPIGSPGHILKVNSGGTAPEWGAAPATGVTSVALSSSDLTVTGSPVTSSGTITANLTNSGVSAGTYSKVTVDAKGRVTTGATAAIADVTGLQTALDAKQPSGSYAAAVHTHAISDVTGLQTALDGKQASGNYATLVNGTVPSDQLPSYVDDVVEYANLAAFPVTGESGKIYVAIDTRKTYRWSGSAYVEISPSEVTSVAGRTGAVTLAVADVSDAVPTSRTISAGTGLTGGGDLTANRTLAVTYGTTSGTVCQGNDTRLSDSRTPTAHAASHASAGSDPVTIGVEQVFTNYPPSLLLRFNGSNGSTVFTDSSSNALTVTANGNAAISTAQSKFGGASGYFDGNGDYLTLSNNAVFGFGAGDFTIEYWHYPLQNSGNETIVDLRPSDTAEWLVLGKSGSGEVRCYDGSQVRVGGSMNLNAWNHVAWSRVSGNNTIYLNGVSVITFANGGDVGSSRTVTIGANASPQFENAYGYIDELRVVKGAAVYTSNFTPPTTQLSTSVAITLTNLLEEKADIDHATSHLAGTKAQYNDQVAGMSTNVYIRANNVGTAGNSITLAFDGVDDIETVLAAWNSANASNQATLVSGNGAQVPDNGEEIVLSGGVAAGSDPLFDQKLNTTDDVAFNSAAVGASAEYVIKDSAELGWIALTNGSEELIKSNATGAVVFEGSEAFFGFADRADNTNTGKRGGFYKNNGCVHFWNNQISENTVSIADNGDVLIGRNAYGTPTGTSTTSSWGKKFQVNGNVTIRDNTGNETATFDAQAKLTANRTYDLPDASGTLALTSDIPANTIASTIVDAKGDLIVGTAADTVARLPVGATNGHVLTVDSAEASGMKWAAASGGVTSVSGTAPIVSSGGTTPTISVTTGSTAGTVAAGDDSRITGAAQKSANLSDLASASTARTNLGLGTAAVEAASAFAQASHTHELTALAATGATNGHVLTANGSNGATFAALPASGVTGAAASASDVLGVSGSNITGVDANADRIVYWNNTSNKLAYGTPADAGAAAASHTHGTGDITGLAAIATSGSASDLGSGTVPIARLGASGTPSGSTYLAGDNTWKSVTGGVSAMQSIAINFVLN